MEKLGLKPHQYFLFTTHREENVDDKQNLQKIVAILKEMRGKYDKEIVFSMHPRTAKMLETFEMMEQVKNIEGVHIIEPIGYLDFLKLQSNSHLILTDSGGIQEESCILGIPCVTLRNNTERPETVEVGANSVAGLETESVLKAVEQMKQKSGDWRNPFGDGTAAETIIETVATHLDK